MINQHENVDVRVPLNPNPEGGMEGRRFVPDGCEIVYEEQCSCPDHVMPMKIDHNIPKTFNVNPEPLVFNQVEPQQPDPMIFDSVESELEHLMASGGAYKNGAQESFYVDETRPNNKNEFVVNSLPAHNVDVIHERLNEI